MKKRGPSERCCLNTRKDSEGTIGRNRGTVKQSRLISTIEFRRPAEFRHGSSLVRVVACTVMRARHKSSSIRGKAIRRSTTKRVEWEAGDVVRVPLFAWHQHTNTGNEPAIWFKHTSAALYKQMGLLMRDARPGFSGSDDVADLQGRFRAVLIPEQSAHLC